MTVYFILHFSYCISILQIMSKNTSSSAFRKIDVDQYNEDNYKEDECGESQSPPVGPDEKEIINFLNQYPFIKNVLKRYYYI